MDLSLFKNRNNIMEKTNKPEGFRIINHHYQLKYNYTPRISGEYSNQLVGKWDDNYTDAFLAVPRIASRLRENSESRQALININSIGHNSCLISVQWLIIDEMIYCIANYRSQHERLGRPADEEYLNYLNTLMMYELPEYDFGITYVNVGDYHDYYL